MIIPQYLNGFVNHFATHIEVCYKAYCLRTECGGCHTIFAEVLKKDRGSQRWIQVKYDNVRLNRADITDITEFRQRLCECARAQVQLQLEDIDHTVALVGRRNKKLEGGRERERKRINQVSILKSKNLEMRMISAK